MNKPWEEYPDIWPTKASFMTYIRGGIRRGLWEKHPVKLEFIKKNRFKAPLGKKTVRNPDGMVWACRCALTGEIVRQSDCQVDHIKGNHSLKTEEDIKDFIMSMVYVSENDLQMVSKEAHKVKSYAERQGIDFEEAQTEKEVIKFKKLSASNQQNELLRLGLVVGSNSEQRINTYREYLLKRN